jgi:hypothetical protein
MFSSFFITFDLMVFFLLSTSLLWISVALTNKVIHDWWKSDHSQYPSWEDFLCLPKCIKYSLQISRKGLKYFFKNQSSRKKN